LSRLTKVLGEAQSKDFVIYSLHRFDTDHECDGRTDRRTPRPCLRRTKHSAIAPTNIGRRFCKYFSQKSLAREDMLQPIQFLLQYWPLRSLKVN